MFAMVFVEACSRKHAVEHRRVNPAFEFHPLARGEEQFHVRGVGGVTFSPGRFHELNGCDDQQRRLFDGNIVGQASVLGDDRVVGDPFVGIVLKVGNVRDGAGGDLERVVRQSGDPARDGVAGRAAREGGGQQE